MKKAPRLIWVGRLQEKPFDPAARKREFHRNWIAKVGVTTAGLEYRICAIRSEGYRPDGRPRLAYRLTARLYDESGKAVILELKQRDFPSLLKARQAAEEFHEERFFQSQSKEPANNLTAENQELVSLEDLFQQITSK